MECNICGKTYKILHNHLIKVHQIKPCDYDGELLDDELRKKYIELNSGVNNPRFNKIVSKETREKLRIIVSKKETIKKGYIKEYIVKCNKCENTIIIKCKSKIFNSDKKYFCSKSCANTRVHSNETKLKISKSGSVASKKMWQNEEYANKQLNRPKMFNSKGEKEIRSYFIDTFKNDGWTYGGGLVYKNESIARDLYSNKLKICIEYDGIWHFKDIHGQLKKKQFKDKLLEEWCLENNYRLIRIKDDLYNLDKTKYLNLLIESTYNSNEQIIKIY